GGAGWGVGTVAGTGGLTLEETSGLVGVAGHDVAFDATRNRWYCDLRVDVGPSYLPFIKLALARYQPNSIAGVELSRVIQADFIQLTPDRAASVTYKSDTLVLVTVTGLSYKRIFPGLLGQPGPGRIEVQLQVRDPRIPDPDLGWTDVGDPQVMKSFGLPPNPTHWSSQLTLPSPRTQKRF